MKEAPSPSLFVALLLVVTFCGIWASWQQPRAWAKAQTTREASFLDSGKNAVRTVEKLQVPAGTRIHVRLKDTISTGSDHEGDHFSGTLDRPIRVAGKTLALEGSPLVGKLKKLTKLRDSKRQIEVAMVLEKISVGGRSYSLKTEVLDFRVPASVPPTPPPGPTEERLGLQSRTRERPRGGELVIYEPGTRLTFKLAEPLQLPIPPREH